MTQCKLESIRSDNISITGESLKYQVPPLENMVTVGHLPKLALPSTILGVDINRRPNDNRKS